MDKVGIPAEDKLVVLYQCSYPACVLSHFSPIRLCDPTDCDPSGSSVHGIVQAKYWSGLPCPPPGALPTQGLNSHLTVSPALQAGFLPLPGNPCSYSGLGHYALVIEDVNIWKSCVKRI